MLKIFKVLFGAIFFLSGCQKSGGGTTTGNPLVSFTMTASSSAPSNNVVQGSWLFTPLLLELFKPAFALPLPVMTDSTGLSVTLNESWMAVEEVEFKAEETSGANENNEREVSFEGPFVVNLLTSNPESFGMVRISQSQIRRIKMKMHAVTSLPNNAPVGMLGNSIFWSGNVDGQQLVFSTAEEFEYESAGPNGINLVDNANVLLSIKIASIIKKIDLSGFRSSPPNGGVINASHRFPTTSSKCPSIDASAADLYTCFKSGLKSESKLGRDDDGNDEIEDDEESVH